MGFQADGNLIPHLTYSFQHANLWHMLANLFVLWSINQRMNVVSGYLVAVAASFLPMFTDKPTARRLQRIHQGRIARDSYNDVDTQYQRIASLVLLFLRLYLV